MNIKTRFYLSLFFIIPALIIQPAFAQEVIENSATVSAQNVQVASDSASVSTQTETAIAVSNSIIEANVISDDSQLTAIIDSSAQVKSTTSAIADTGHNTTASASDSALITGNAVAVANNISLINLTLEDSEINLLIQNIDPNSDSTLIFPRPELYQQPIESESVSPSSLSNLAQVSTNVAAVATTGDNTTIASQSTQTNTGDAYACTQQFDIINSLIQNSNYYSVVINHPLTDFLIPDYNGPLDSTSTPEQTSFTVGELTSANYSSDNSTLSQNSTLVSSTTTAIANTGQNIVIGQTTQLDTGVAIAIANSIQFINSYISNSKIFIGIVNFLGSWSGSAHFNYPDLQLSAATSRTEVYPQDSIIYTATVSNPGYDVAHQLKLVVHYQDQEFTFDPTDLLPNQSQTFTLSIPITHPQSDTIAITATAFTSDPETNTQNNSTTSLITILHPNTNSQPPLQLSSTNSKPESSLPQLHIQARHNAVDPVNPGDTLTFQISLQNDSDSLANDTIIYHLVYNQFGDLVGSFSIPVGQLLPHESGQLNFGLTLPADNSWLGTHFTTESFTNCTSNSGQTISSNISTTSFFINTNTEVASLPLPQITSQPEILGLIQQETFPTENRLPNSPQLNYLMIFLTSAAYLANNSKIRKSTLH